MKNLYLNLQLMLKTGFYEASNKNTVLSTNPFVFFGNAFQVLPFIDYTHYQAIFCLLNFLL